MTELSALFPDGGDERTLTTQLPPGRLVWPKVAEGDPPAERPVYWLSDTPASAELWSSLLEEHPTSGLWPLLLDPVNSTYADPDRPWVVGEVTPGAVTDIDGYDPAELMRTRWTGWVAADSEYDYKDLEPFRRTCPGLAEPGELMDAPDALADWLAGSRKDEKTRIGLVAASRGADTLTVLGWCGPVNSGMKIAAMSAILRGWEDRFGARVVRVGFDTLDLSVAAPPVTMEHALRVAAEHFVFCPDNIQQGAGTLRRYAEDILRVNQWSFWWD
ncbi:uncharacterized protein DUF4253 [Actinomadura pelletieri DSM 43383]|uniref:Uncharacterized protein DUF4253 n=1 Tax=Actinomadura pelletieri DSM 43383 TaxID=1120940 RepID=A0A495QRG2_9ACTN|nr:DUF4253 domain-containing protein [Actinomadura pelletieri]RKS76082.1 uncharacterized protein DUF4253 [Actinomadura pelletieri DSM 43383]